MLAWPAMHYAIANSDEIAEYNSRYMTVSEKSIYLHIKNLNKNFRFVYIKKYGKCIWTSRNDRQSFSGNEGCTKEVLKEAGVKNWDEAVIVDGYVTGFNDNS